MTGNIIPPEAEKDSAPPPENIEAVQRIEDSRYEEDLGEGLIVVKHKIRMGIITIVFLLLPIALWFFSKWLWKPFTFGGP